MNGREVSNRSLCSPADLKEAGHECDSICMGAAAVPNLQDLQERAFEAYRRALAQTRVVTHAARLTPSAMPILYFGDLDAYVASPVRIVTVGLNPSQAEFPLESATAEPDRTDDPWQRFPSAAGCSPTDPIYLLALNAYFRTRPYRWFDTYRSLLAGLQASFVRSERENTALHTDLCTPVPTTPTWSGLSRRDQEVLAADGHGLWRDLIERLRPDIVVVSVAARHLTAADLGDPNTWPSALTITSAKDGRPRAAAYHLRTTRTNVGASSAPLIVWGQAANVPFGTVSNIDREQIGARVLALWQQTAAPRSAA